MHWCHAARIFLCLFFTHMASTTELYTLSLHDALPICAVLRGRRQGRPRRVRDVPRHLAPADGEGDARSARSEEHTSELQSQFHLVCRLLLEKKKKIHGYMRTYPGVVAVALRTARRSSR